MKIGFYYFATDYSMPVVEVARELEAHGYESLFVPEHTHIPAARRSPWPGGPELPRQYSHTLDPYVGLAAAAAVTKTLRLGTGVSLLTERDPIVTAKIVATLDLISHGRFEFGIGAGWNAEEMENHGTRFEDRFKVMVDRAKAMKAIWTQDEAAYDGEFTKFEKIWSWPKPVQKPHPPILLGGETKFTLRRVMEFCDGWFPRGRGLRGSQGRDGAAQELRGRGRARHQDRVDDLVRHQAGGGLRRAVPGGRPRSRAVRPAAGGSRCGHAGDRAAHHLLRLIAARAQALPGSLTERRWGACRAAAASNGRRSSAAAS